MDGKTRVSSCGLVIGILLTGIGPAWTAEGASGAPELLPIPAPQETPPGASRQYPPQATHGPPQAGEDAYRMAEQSRRAAIDRQLQLQQDIQARNIWAPYVYRYALPYIYAYAPPRVARRVHRELDRPAVGPVLVPGPLVPGRYPYSSSLQQPLGHEKIWMSPNGYVYRPRYPEPTSPAPVPTPAVPPAPPSGAVGSALRVPPGATLPASPAPPAQGGPELIPAPPSEPAPGPREF
jgi:hypothetical protein